MPRRTRIPARRDHTRCEFCGDVVTAKYGCDCELSTWVMEVRRVFPGVIVEGTTSVYDNGSTDNGTTEGI